MTEIEFSQLEREIAGYRYDILDNYDFADDYEVHHDYMGWYIVAPDELRDEAGCGPDGISLGFDGRPHYATEADARRAL